MKKLICIILALILVSSLTACDVGSKVKYGSWKDTHESYGDGTYQIFTRSYGEKHIYGLSNEEYMQCVIDNIKYLSKENDILYVAGTFNGYNAYAVANIKSNFLKYYIDIKEDEVLGMININSMINGKDMVVYKSFDEFSTQEKNKFKEMQEKGEIYK
ncbi:MAG: hypothetical protein Q8873_05580 [Bacillota bacterium]|nr:hypothetical protein [Bacillota bacterium]